jgi:hypothetical protein
MLHDANRLHIKGGNHATGNYLIGRPHGIDRLEPNGVGTNLVRPQHDHWRPGVQFHEPETMQGYFSAVFSAIEASFAFKKQKRFA